MIACLLFFLFNNFQAQELDSLFKVLKTAQNDTFKLAVLVSITDNCELEDIEKYANEAITLADELILINPKNKRVANNYKAIAINNKAFLYHSYSKLDKAVEEYRHSLQIFEQSEDTNGIIMSCNNISLLEKDLGHIDLAIGYLDRALLLSTNSKNIHKTHQTHVNYSALYSRIGLLDEAIEHAYLALKIQERIGDIKGKASAFNNIGSLFFMQKDLQKAEDYFNKALTLRKEANDYYGLGIVYNNLAKVYVELNKLEKALEYYQYCIENSKIINNQEGEAQAYSNIGSLYFNLGNYDKAYEFYKKSIDIRESIEELEGLCISYEKMAEYLLAIKKYKEAEVYGNKALKIAQKLGYNSSIEFGSKILSEIYEKLGDYKKAYNLHKLYVLTRDSLFNAATQKTILTKEINYQYDKKKLTDSLEHEKEKEVKDLALAKQEAQLQKEKTQRFALYGGIFLILVFAGFVYNRFRISQQQKKIIEVQKQEVEMQKHLVEEKHKEITDSINYAERIQRSFLATNELLNSNLNDYFVMFRPKDVVSGDFYWATKLFNKTFALVAADSTGHGVPGAIMSILNITCLEKAVDEEKLVEPGEILNHARKKIIERLKKDGSEDGGKDGMDASLVCFDFANKKLVYAAANNPLWIVRDNEMLEFSPDKMPVGKHDKQDIPFSQHEIALNKGDVVYMLTDGLPDQFGGPKGKKFMYKKLKELLVSISKEEMSVQHQLLTEAFDNWKGNLEQVDDVTLIGVRV